MPLYEYQREDGTIFEVIQKFSDEPLAVCPDTGQKVERLISKSAFHLKGGGWYKSDYGSSGSAGTASSAPKSGDSSDSSGANDKKDASASGDSSKSAGSCSKGSACGCH